MAKFRSEMTIHRLKSKVIQFSGIRMLFGSSMRRNWGSLVITGLVSQALGMLATIRIARVLRPDGFGEYNLVLTITSVAFILSGLGLRSVIIRQCARDPYKSPSIFQKSILIRAVLAVGAAIGVLLYTSLIQGYGTIAFNSCILFLLIGQLVWDCTESVMFGLQNMVMPSVINLIGSVTWVCIIWLMPSPVLTSRLVVLLVALLQAGKAIALTRLLLRSDRIQRPMYSRITVEYRTLVREGLPFYWLAIMTAAVSSIPILFLGLRSTSAELGLFNAPARILSPLQLLLSTGIAVLYPMLSNQSVSDHTAFVQTVRKAMVAIIIVGSCLGLCVSLVRTEVVLLLFGPEYEQCADILMYQCWFTLLLAIYSLIGTVLSARDRQRTLAIISTVYAVTTIPFVWLGSGHGAIGLVIGMLFGGIVNFVYHWIVFQRVMPIAFANRESLLLLCLAGIFAVPAWWLPIGTNWIVRIAIILLAIAFSGVILFQARRLFIGGKSSVIVSLDQV